MCNHNPTCPNASDAGCCRAHVLADHSEQGWCLLCNGLIIFDDGAYLAPDGTVRLILLAQAA